MKKLMSLVLAILVLALPIASFAVEYPVNSDKTLTIWKILDGSINGAGFTTSLDTPGFKAWTEAAGIKVELQEFNDADALRLAISAATTLPDVLQCNRNLFAGGIMTMVADDLVTELTPEMLEENAPDYWAFINKDLYLKEIVQLDGKMYSLAGHSFEPGSVFRYWRGFFYRGDLLAKVGKEVPTTAEEFYDVLVAFKNAGIKTPLVFQGTGDLAESMKNGDVTSPFGLVNAAEYHIDGVFHYGAYEAEYKEVLRFMKKLFDEGLISVDYMSMEGSVAQASICNGDAGAFYGNNSRLNTFKGALQEGEFFVPGPGLKTADGQNAMFSFADPMVSSDDFVFITPDCENPELVLNLYNFLFTEQGQLIRDFGVEGESYTMVDGVPTYTELVTNNPDGYALDGVARSWALINWPGIHGDVQLAARHPEKTQVAAYELWGSSQADTYRIVPANTVLEEYADEYASLWTDLNLYMNESRAKFINGELDLDADWDNYIETLKKMGMDRVYEMKQATVDAYNAAAAGK